MPASGPGLYASASHHHDSRMRRALADLPDNSALAIVSDERGGAAVVQDERELVGLGRRVDHHEDAAGLERGEDRRGPPRRSSRGRSPRGRRVAGRPRSSARGQAIGRHVDLRVGAAAGRRRPARPCRAGIARCPRGSAQPARRPSRSCSFRSTKSARRSDGVQIGRDEILVGDR